MATDPPQPGSIHRATVRNIRPFGVFVEMEGYRRHGLVHNSQISEEVSFSREDEDEAKVKAMEFFAPVGSQVYTPFLLQCQQLQHLVCLCLCAQLSMGHAFASLAHLSSIHDVCPCNLACSNRAPKCKSNADDR